MHGFAHLALTGQFSGFAPDDGREALLRDTLAPMLEQQLKALATVVGSPGVGRPR